MGIQKIKNTNEVNINQILISLFGKIDLNLDFRGLYKKSLASIQDLLITKMLIGLILNYHLKNVLGK